MKVWKTKISDGGQWRHSRVIVTYGVRVAILSYITGFSRRLIHGR